MSMPEEDEIRDEPLTTLGELFADGSAIDLLRHDRLILWSEGREQVELLLKHQGQSYLPASLDPKLEELLRLPAGMAPLESLETLVDQLTGCIAGCADLDEATLLLLAAFVLSTCGRVLAMCSRFESLGDARVGNECGRSAVLPLPPSSAVVRGLGTGPGGAPPRPLSDGHSKADQGA